MDEIDRSQIGKRSETLVGWEDQPKKGIGTNYPPMRAKGAKGYSLAYARESTSSGGFWGVVIFILLIGAAISKVYGLW
jgi:hypothetical protein